MTATLEDRIFQALTSRLICEELQSLRVEAEEFVPKVITAAEVAREKALDPAIASRDLRALRKTAQDEELRAARMHKAISRPCVRSQPVTRSWNQN